jgi:hypothetical protein
MGQYQDLVDKQRTLLLAEEWAKTVKGLHVHSLDSMWYDDRPQDTADGKFVTDISFNNGLTERTLENGTKVYFGEVLKGDELLWAYEKSN